jgi:hypothetical protein
MAIRSTKLPAFTNKAELKNEAPVRLPVPTEAIKAVCASCSTVWLTDRPNIAGIGYIDPNFSDVYPRLWPILRPRTLPAALSEGGLAHDH